MSYPKKIASAAVQNRAQTPFWNWIRSKLLAVDRDPSTPPPGLPTADGKAIYHNPSRFPNTQSARSRDPPAIPGGVHHKLNANYYLERDGRRSVDPPPSIYAADRQGVRFGSQTGQSIEAAQAVNKGPGENFGLAAPTPGFGLEWTRSKDNELSTQQDDTEFARIEKFDRFTRST